MKKIKQAVALGLALIMAVVSVCLGLSLGSRPVRAEENTEKTYIVATDTTFAPFEFQNSDGDFVGIDMDLLEAISRDQGFNYEIQPLGFNAAVQALEAGQVDAVIAGMTITPEREQSFDFSVPYYSAGSIFAVQSGSDIQSVEDLAGKKVAVKTGTSSANLANEMKDEIGFTVTVFEDSSNMYEDVLTGNSDAAVEDYPVMAYAINSGLNLRLIGDQYNSGDYGLAVQKGKNQEFLNQFNQGLANIKASGEYDEIINKYLSSNATTKNENGFWNLIKVNWKQLLEGLLTTLKITLVSIIGASVIGILIGLMRVSDLKWVRNLAIFYIDIFRGIPVLVLAFFVYFGIPQIFNFTMPASLAGVITLSLNASAYIAEIVRGGIEGVPKGQSEAGRSLGLTKSKTMRKIILPQAIRLMIPSIINQFVITLKDTSILSVIGIVELTQTGKIIIARTYQSGAMWLIIGIMYIAIITLLTKLSNALQRKYGTLA